MPPKPITEHAWAKVNLTLHVTGQRADGYHLLDSLVVFCGIGDCLQASPAAQTSLTLCGPHASSLPAGDDNLVLRAAAAFAADFPVAFVLEKNLPPASGIGGGSADAAAAIRAVRRLRALAGRPSQDAEGGDPMARDKALRLGADVPVCLVSRPVRMRGVGENLTPLTVPPAWIVLANPRVEVPTPAVFRALACKDNAAMPAVLPAWPDVVSLASWLSRQRNDLEDPARGLAPQIAAVIVALQGAEGALIARMSGSGATCFALFGSEAAARNAAIRIAQDHPEWWTAAGPVHTGQTD